MADKEKDIFCYTFDELLDQHADFLERTSDAFEPMAFNMAKHRCYDWKSSVSEHICRAISSRVTGKQLGETLGNQEAYLDKGRGFVYLDGLVEKLVEFENSRDTYPTISDFLPELLTVFESPPPRR